MHHKSTRADYRCDVERITLLASCDDGGEVEAQSTLLWSKRITSAVRARTAVLGVAALDCFCPCSSVVVLSASLLVLCPSDSTALSCPLYAIPPSPQIHPSPSRHLFCLQPPSLTTLHALPFHLRSHLLDRHHHLISPHHTSPLLITPQRISSLSHTSTRINIPRHNSSLYILTLSHLVSQQATSIAHTHWIMERTRTRSTIH
jgi:hypothetical protein